ncbi:TlpA family protein disulfide reductase [Actinomyces gerencseriae]|uniref:TlpA family protein disulfide reductase n=1 Tax=Actinomyces gerencseriae TaxID=52769 RepID=UPI000478EB49|nr:TlpA disulfide reductase family protein [Actinomyces gerencseriae]
MPDHDEEPVGEPVDDPVELPGSGDGPVGEPEPAPVGEPPVEEEPTPSAKADWRARIRRSGFGQVAVLLVTSFAIAIAAWWAIKPNDSEDPQAETAVVTQVDVEGAQRAPTQGDAAPAFAGTDIDSRQVSLTELRGRPVWLMFVATWCTGCRTEMPDVRDAVTAHGDDVQVVVVYVGESASAVRSYSDRVGNRGGDHGGSGGDGGGLTEVADQSQEISAAYGVMGVPSHFFIDGDGVVRETHVGLLGPDQMARSIEALKAP